MKKSQNKYKSHVDKDKWYQMHTAEQLANIGSEVFRAMKWKKLDKEIANSAYLRAMDLFYISIEYAIDKKMLGYLQELCRLKEFWLDFYKGDNQYNSDEQFFNNYFYDMTIYANKIRTKTNFKF